MLEGATVEALLTLYFQIVNRRRCLDAHLAEPASEPFTPTKFYRIAEFLVGFDNEIQNAKNAQIAVMDVDNDDNDDDDDDDDDGSDDEDHKKPTRKQNATAKEKSDSKPAPLQNLVSASSQASKCSVASSQMQPFVSTEPATPTVGEPTPSSAPTPLPQLLSKSDTIVPNAAHAHAHSAIQYATLNQVLHFFEDPADADSLIRRERYMGLFWSRHSDTIPEEIDSDTGDEYRPVKGRPLQVEYRGIQFDLCNSDHISEANRSRIFLAALHLKDRFQRLVCDLTALHKADLTVKSYNLKELVFALRFEPMLSDATVEAMLTLYFQLINAKRCLDAHLAEPTSAPFTPTHLYKISEYLVGYDSEIQKAKYAHMAVMDGSNNESRKPMQVQDQDTTVKKRSGNKPSSFQSPVGASPHTSTRSFASPPKRSTSSTKPTSPRPTLSPILPSVSTLQQTQLSGCSHEKVGQEMSTMRTQIADLLAMVKTQQATIEGLQGKLDTVESELTKSKESQDVLQIRLLEATEENKDMQVSIGHLSVVLEGTTASTVKNAIQIKRLQSRAP
ncbi:hypothetical protein BGZ81_005631 [Podila clonocystis]|nr:hypothetical protein BGZ81_005631 [Podila clonocystis]